MKCCVEQFFGWQIEIFSVDQEVPGGMKKRRRNKWTTINLGFKANL